MDLLITLALLLFAHALADYPLQGDFMARAKNPALPLPGVPWETALTMHAAIHAGFVGLITGSLLLALFELVVHWLIDYAKCRGVLSFREDQVLHVGCKVLWALVVAVGGLP